MVIVPVPPPPPPGPSQIRPGSQFCVPPPPPPPPPLGSGIVVDCCAPVTVTVALACVPVVATGEALAVESPGSSTLVRRPRASLHARRCLPASSLLITQLSPL